VEIPAVDVQGALLVRDRVGNMRVTVPDRGHIVVEVDVTPAGLIEDIGSLPSHQLNRVAIEEFRTGAE
jgi:hypothetical protein